MPDEKDNPVEQQSPKVSDRDLKTLYDTLQGMAHHLSDPNKFKQAVRERVGQNERWQTLLEVLPDNPILVKAGDEWQWLFDFWGNPLPAPQAEASEDVEALVDEAKEPAESPLPDVSTGRDIVVNRPLRYRETVREAVVLPLVVDVHSKIDGIREVQSAVRWFTEDRLTLETLANGLRILEISPPYSAFDGAAQSFLASAGRGAKPAAYASRSADVAIIDEYWNLLIRSSLSMKRALFLAELLVTQSEDGSSKTRARTHAMRLLSEDLDFSRLSIQEIETLLGKFANDIPGGSQFGDTAAEYRAIDGSLLTREWLEEVVLKIAKTEWPTIWTISPVGEYFESRAKALLLHIRNGEPLRRLTLPDLLYRATGRAPAFHGDPDTLSLRVYAEALDAARAAEDEITHHGNQQFIFAVLIKLGFGSHVESRILANPDMIDKTFAQDLLEAARQVFRSGERVVVLIGGAKLEIDPYGTVRRNRGDGSLTQGWTPSRQHAVLPMFADAPWVSPDTAGLKPTLVLFEGLTKYDVDSLQLTRMPKTEIFPARLVEISMSADSRWPVVVQPKSLDDAVAQAQKFFS